MTISVILGLTSFVTFLGTSIFKIQTQKNIKELKKYEEKG